MEARRLLPSFPSFPSVQDLFRNVGVYPCRSRGEPQNPVAFQNVPISLQLVESKAAVVLTPDEITLAVDIQRRSYRLLRWLEKAFNDGFVSPDTAGRYGSDEEAAQAWIEKHFLNIPPDARPEDRRDLPMFATFFTSYLSNSFDLELNPGQQLYSPEAHCFCPICSWLVQRPHLRPKKLTAADKKRAARLKRQFVEHLALQINAPVTERLLDDLCGAPELREPIGLCTYAADLLQRLRGLNVGPASLALWRSFAWTPEGSPRRGFELRSADILRAQEELQRRLLQPGP